MAVWYRADEDSYIYTPDRVFEWASLGVTGHPGSWEAHLIRYVSIYNSAREFETFVGKALAALMWRTSRQHFIGFGPLVGSIGMAQQIRKPCRLLVDV